MNIKRKLVSPILMWLIVAVGLLIIFQVVSPRLVFRKNIFMAWLVVPAMGYWIYFFLGAIKVHHKAPFSVDGVDKIITSGVYGKVRHPIYSADIVLAWSIFFFYPDVRFLMGAHWLMFVLLFWMRREERALVEKFGHEYAEYMARVPKIFPKFFQ